jgi:hypothetical protein
MKFIINENPRSKKHHKYIKKNPKYLNCIHDLLRGYYNSLKHKRLRRINDNK